MPRVAILFLVFLLLSCVRENDPPISEVIVDSPPAETQRDLCDFDISDKEGEFTLYQTWEFAGFQHIENGTLDNLTCLARVADFALNGEDWDNLYKVTLTFTEIASKLEDCQSDFAFEAISFGSKIAGCYEKSMEGISFHIPENGVESLPGPAFTTMPVISFAGDFIEYLKAAKVYHIEKNKLYLYGKPGDYRMTFVALED